MKLYPLKFRPQLKTLVWGTESWEVSAVEGSESVVADGPLSGKTLSSLCKEFGAALLGKHVADAEGGKFPLLIKFIDAKTDLSIQVHPNDEMAARCHNGSKGKTEMWYVIDAAEGAHLYSGLAKEITPEEYETRIADGSITDVLARHDVSAGDVFFIPAGRVHAICGGCYIAEIQQTSDITYRIWDYKRLGLDGKPRQLHTELAKEAIDYRVYPDYRSSYEKVRNEEALLVDCPFFTTSLLDADAPFTKELGGSDSFLVLMCTGGEGSLSLEGAEVDGMPVQVRAGETLLIPACAEKLHVNPSGDGIKLLLSCQCSR